MNHHAVTTEDVAALARAADLPMKSDRLQGVADVLTSWLPSANDLSIDMASWENLTVTPITVFTQVNSIESQA